MHEQADPIPATPGSWTDPDGRTWEVVLRWGRMDGRIECTGLELRSLEDPPARLTTTVMRAFPLADVVRETKRQNAAFQGWWAGQVTKRRRPRPDLHLSPPPEELLRRAQEWSDAAARGPGGAPRQYGPDHFAKVAEVYTAALNAGRSDPRQAVREWADATENSASSSAVAKWIARARTMGLLPPTTRGRT